MTRPLHKTNSHSTDDVAIGFRGVVRTLSQLHSERLLAPSISDHRLRATDSPRIVPRPNLTSAPPLSLEIKWLLHTLCRHLPYRMRIRTICIHTHEIPPNRRSTTLGDSLLSPTGAFLQYLMRIMVTKLTTTTAMGTTTHTHTNRASTNMDTGAPACPTQAHPFPATSSLQHH